MLRTRVPLTLLRIIRGAPPASGADISAAVTGPPPCEPHGEQKERGEGMAPLSVTSLKASTAYWNITGKIRRLQCISRASHRLRHVFSSLSPAPCWAAQQSLAGRVSVVLCIRSLIKRTRKTGRTERRRERGKKKKEREKDNSGRRRE